MGLDIKINDMDLDIKINELFVKNGQIYRFALRLPNKGMYFAAIDPEKRHADFTWSVNRFVDAVMQREIVRYEIAYDAEGNIVSQNAGCDLLPNAEETKKVQNARSLWFYLRKWHDAPTSLTASRLDEFVEEQRRVAEKDGHLWAPSSGTMRRYIRRYPDIRELTARFVISHTGKSKRAPWHPRVARLLEAAIEYHWAENTAQFNLTDTTAWFYGEFEKVAQELGEEGCLLEPLKCPSRETIRAYVNSAECYETVCRKFGKKIADAQFKGNFHPAPAHGLLDTVLIDSTVLDAWCAFDDETMLPLGRPTLTIAIDLYTRMILAVIITFEPPSLFTAMACLKRVNQTKVDINERWPKIQRVSDGWGKPRTVLIDNELAQTGKSYQAACEDAKITVNWAPVKRPQYKAVVERFFLTLKKILIDKLPGAVPFAPHIMRQLEIDPTQTASVSLGKLNEIVNMAINDVYHYETHSTINMPPALAWEKAKLKNRGRPFIGDIEFLERAFGVLKHGELTTSGIRFENMLFHDEDITGALLDDLADQAPRRARRRSPLSSLNPKVMFKYNPADLSAIHVWNSRRKEYVGLPNAMKEASYGLSLWHWKVLRIWAEQENIAFSSPEEQYAARRRLTEIVREQMPGVAYKQIKQSRRILHEPSDVVEGALVRTTTAPPSVPGTAPSDIDIAVREHAPDGDRIPPPGPVRGGKKGRKRRSTRGDAGMTVGASAPKNKQKHETVIALLRQEIEGQAPRTPEMAPDPAGDPLKDFLQKYVSRPKRGSEDRR